MCRVTNEQSLTGYTHVIVLDESHVNRMRRATFGSMRFEFRNSTEILNDSEINL